MRTIILLAGVAMNLLLAFVIFVFIAGFADPSVDIRVNGLAPATTSGGIAPAVAAGLTPAKQIGGTADAPVYDQSGDVITAIDGQQVAFFTMPARPASPTPGSAYLRAHAGQQVTLSLLHANGIHRGRHRPPRRPTMWRRSAPLVNGATGQGVLGIVGYWYQPGPTIVHDPLTAISLGAQRTVMAAATVVNAVGGLLGNLRQPAGRRPDRHRRHRGPGPHGEPARSSWST